LEDEEMSAIMTLVLVIGGPLLAVVFVVGVIALIGMLGFDAVASRRTAPALTAAEAGQRLHVSEQEHAVTRMYLERGVARAFVMLGGVFWGICLIAVAVWFRPGMERLLYIVLLPVLMNVACLIVGWYWERTASVMLAVAAGLAAWWGLANGFEPTILIMLIIGPMLTASVLFWLARRGEAKLAIRVAAEPTLTPAQIDR
jgi:hypothetical protein